MINDEFDLPTLSAQDQEIDHLASIQPSEDKDLEVHTPLLSFTFHKFKAGNDIVVDAGSTTSLLLMNTFNGTADQLCQAIARHYHDIQITVQGREAVGNDKGVRPSTMFDEKGKLLPIYANVLTDSRRIRAETLYASLVAHYTSLEALIAKHNEVLPGHAMQFAYVGNDGEKKGFAPGATFDPREAIRYRLATNKNRIAIFETQARINEGLAHTQPNDAMSTAELLKV